MRKETLKQKTIGQIVADDFRAAAIFKSADIDFCCGGNKSLEAVCSEKQVDFDKLSDKIMELELSSPGAQYDYKNWDLAFLADYIVNTHHKYILKTLPELLFYTKKIAGVHGGNHPELEEVASIFSEINRELIQHLKQEEVVLFPAIKKVLNNNSSDAKKSIQTEIARMNGEHEFVGGSMDKINAITKAYAVPSDGCNTYHVTFKLLREFEDDLHIHVHLENNLLFPKALELTK